MKKLIIALTTLAVCLCSVLAGCSCSSDQSLAFSDNWKQQTGIGYSETAEYTVKLDKAFSLGKLSYTKDATLNDDLVFFDYQGTYSVTTTLFASTDIEPSEVGNSDLLGKVEKVIYQHAELHLTSSFRYGDMTDVTQYDDYIITNSYFADCQNSLMPIYDSSESVVTYLTYSNGRIATPRLETLSVSKYTSSGYSFDTTTTSLSSGESDVSKKSYSYTPRTLIDNTVLLFALRNTSINDNSSVTMPVTSISYAGEKKTLKITNYMTYSLENYAITVNETEKTGTIPLKCYAFSVNETSSGRSQIACIQNGKSEDMGLEISALVRYVEPLITYNNNAFMLQGALVYELTSISFG